MILYRDECITEYEQSGQWTNNIKYLTDCFKAQPKNEAVFLKLSVTIWYCLTLDGVELSLFASERESLGQKLRECFDFFVTEFFENDTCQWMFGYMMEVRPDLFFSLDMEYNEIEEQGKNFIKKSALQGNELAKILGGKKTNRNLTSKYKKFLKEKIAESFDESAVVDSYFFEILSGR